MAVTIKTLTHLLLRYGLGLTDRASAAVFLMQHQHDAELAATLAAVFGITKTAIIKTKQEIVAIEQLTKADFAAFVQHADHCQEARLSQFSKVSTRIRNQMSGATTGGAGKEVNTTLKAQSEQAIPQEGEETISVDGKSVTLFVPSMRDSVEKGFRAFSSNCSNTTTYATHHAFNAAPPYNSGWVSSPNKTTNIFIGVTMPRARIANFVTLQTSNGYSYSRSVKQFSVEASHDNAHWTRLGTFTTSFTDKNQQNNFTFDNSNAYSSYRIFIFSNHGDAIYTGCSHLNFGHVQQ